MEVDTKGKRTARARGLATAARALTPWVANPPLVTLSALASDECQCNIKMIAQLHSARMHISYAYELVRSQENIRTWNFFLCLSLYTSTLV